jgi:hypothetical protein
MFQMNPNNAERLAINNGIFYLDETSIGLIVACGEIFHLLIDIFFSGLSQGTDIYK